MKVAANSSMLGLVVSVARPRKIREVIQVSHGSFCQKFMNMEGQTSHPFPFIYTYIHIHLKLRRFLECVYGKAHQINNSNNVLPIVKII